MSGNERKDGLQRELEKKPREQVFLGLGVVVENEFGEILMGIRSNQSGFGLLAIPGGIVEKPDNGDFRAVGKRETLEEFNVDIGETRVDMVSVDTSDIKERGWLNFGLKATVKGRPKVTPNITEYSHGGWYPQEVVRDFLTREPDRIYGPSRVSLLCYFRDEIYYPFNEEEQKSD